MHSQQHGRWPISDDLIGLRRHLYHHAGRAGLAGTRRDDLVLAANEAVINVLEHGGAAGSVSIGYDTHVLTVDVVDTAGRLRPEHARREHPGPDAGRGFGLWLMGHLCDEFTIDHIGESSRVRLRMYLRPAPAGQEGRGGGGRGGTSEAPRPAARGGGAARAGQGGVGGEGV
ncbi:ATP-binding protein, partial [Streptosporangium sp. NPDC048865]|uniref:ATP-binding protein n=1 Tax=Streptosporangium sp. NPDC048865 TaxID=3155766 RepID=UPI00341E55E8